MINSSQRKQAALLFCCLLFFYSVVHQHMGWNQNSRLDLLHALFAQKTFKIDQYHENTGDKSIYNGHYYSDKAPGIVLLAAPAFAISAGILHVLDVPLDSPRGWMASSWITTVGSVGLVTALGGVAMFLLLCRIVDAGSAFVTIFVTFLGAAPFPYATMLFSHSAVAGLLCIAFWAIADERFLSGIIHHPDLEPVDQMSRWRLRHVLAGLCCGLAIASEYTSATVAGATLLLVLLTNIRRAIVIAISAIPPVMLILAYNWICFGGPFSFGYHNLALPEFQGMNKGLFGITLPPKPGAIFLILLSPERGLFMWTPLFLLGFIGLWQVFRVHKRLAFVIAAVAILHVFCIAGYYMPSGGAALGPRHLAPLIPMLVIVTAFGMKQFPRIGVALGYYSLLLTGLASLIDAMPSDSIKNPIFAFYLPHLQKDGIAPNFLAVLGVPPKGSVAVIFSILLIVYFGCALMFRPARRSDASAMDAASKNDGHLEEDRFARTRARL